MKDYYKILDVSPNASPNEIEKKYHFLMSIWHPDKVRNPDWKVEVEERAKEINEAYKILSNPPRRQSYDAQRQAEYAEEQRRQQERAEEERQREERRKQETTQRRAREEQQRREHAEAQHRQREEAQQRQAQAEAQRQQEAYRVNRVMLRKEAKRYLIRRLAILGIIGIIALAICLILGNPSYQRQQTSQYREAQPSRSPSVSPITFQMTALDFFNRGDAKFHKQDYQGALEDYTQVIILDPKYPNAYTNRGVTRFDLRNYEGAVADFTQAITLNPKHAELYDIRGFARIELRDSQGALADYRRAADLYQQQGQTSKYQNALNRITELQR